MSLTQTQSHIMRASAELNSTQFLSAIIYCERLALQIEAGGL